MKADSIQQQKPRNVYCFRLYLLVLFLILSYGGIEEYHFWCIFYKIGKCYLSRHKSLLMLLPEPLSIILLHQKQHKVSFSALNSFCNNSAEKYFDRTDMILWFNAYIYPTIYSAGNSFLFFSCLVLSCFLLSQSQTSFRL